MTICPARLRRAFSEPIYLFQISRQDRDACLFDVSGSSGNDYQVRIQTSVTCTCPDYQRRGRPCKHILFIVVRLLRLSTRDDIEAVLRSTALRINVLDTMLNSIPRDMTEPSSNSTTRATDPSIIVPPRLLDETKECPVCFEPLLNSHRPLVYCRHSCGNVLHGDCHRHWTRYKSDSCVFCRAVSSIAPMRSV